MMKKIYSILMASAAILAVSCEKEAMNIPASIEQRGAFTATISDLTKTDLDGTAANKVVWNAGDEININGKIYIADSDGASTTFTAKDGETPAASTYTAYYPADLFNGTKATLPRYQNYAGNIARLPMVAVSDNSSLSFKNVCGVLHLVLKGSATVKNIKVSNSAVTMADDFTVDESGKAVATSGMVNTIMACGTEGVTLSAGGTDFYIAMVPGDYKDLAIEITTIDGGYAKFSAKTATQSIERNKIYKFEFTPEFEPGILNAWFMVSGKKSVLLAKGNLQYNPSGNVWRFAESQYTMIHSEKAEDVSSEYSSTYTGWIDLFGFGTNGTNSGQKAYQPWSTSSTAADYYNASLKLDAGTDWGNNPISNGGNKAGEWITLSNTDWKNLIDDNKNGLGTVDGAKGLIILPEGFVMPEGLTFTETADNYNTNVYGAVKWAKMEAQGAAFLPAAGRREGTAIKGVNQDSSEIWYRTRTYIDTNKNYTIYFTKGSIKTGQTKSNYFGLSVRLSRNSSNL